MKKSKWIAGVAIAAALTLGTSACAGTGGTASPSDNGSSGNGPKDLGSATILGNWFAEPEMGGYEAADANDLGKPLGVKITFNQGGPGIQTIPQVAAGKADFGVGNADEILVARQSGVPIVAVAAGPAHNLQCLAYHKGSGITDFKDLSGKTVSRVPSPYWDYIQAHFNLKNVQVVNITSPAAFQKDQNMALQCFITSEPYVFKTKGMTDVGYLRVQDSGYDAYQNMLFTTESYIKQNPDKVKAVVEAVTKGWGQLFTDPTATKAFVLKVNPDYDPGNFDFAVDLLKSENLMGDKVGFIDDARMKELADQLVTINQLKSNADYKSAFTDKFYYAGK